MDRALEYLEKRQIELTASRLLSEGYVVESPGIGADEELDIVARKGDKKVAIQVRAQPLLRDSAKEIGQARHAARSRGFDEFRLVVVIPPHEREVEVAGLEDALKTWIEAHPGELAGLTPRVAILSVVNPDIDSVKIHDGQVRVAGSAAVLVESEDGGGDRSLGTTWKTDFPMEFAVTLDASLDISSVEKMEFDLSDREE